MLKFVANFTIALLFTPGVSRAWSNYFPGFVAPSFVWQDCNDYAVNNSYKHSSSSAVHQAWLGHFRDCLSKHATKISVGKECSGCNSTFVDKIVRTTSYCNDSPDAFKSAVHRQFQYDLTPQAAKNICLSIEQQNGLLAPPGSGDQRPHQKPAPSGGTI